MTSERWRKIEELFHAAQELNANGRQAFLAQACQGDDELRRQIEALLARDEDGQILDRPATELLPETTTHRTAPSLSAGEKLGHYEIVDLVGSGGMGEVYRARDSRLRRNVAIKVLPSEVSRDPERRQRFEREGRSVALLNHPNVVSIYDVGEARGIYFLVTELVEGKPLRTADLGVRKALEIAVQIASGLAAAHQAGIVHRDLKPANILLTRSGQVKILDFGLAKLNDAPADGFAQSETVKTQSGMVIGTVNYMSPEQLRGGPIDQRSDIFSFGVILYELLSGRRAFAGSSAEAIAAILNNDLPELPETVPSGVRQIVAHCLEKDPAKRFQSASDLGFAIAALAQNSGRIGSPAASAASHRSRQVWIVAATLASLTAAAFAFAFFTRRTPEANIVRFSFAPPFQADAFNVAVSPDGTRIALTDVVVPGSVNIAGSALWLRSSDSLTAQKLPGTDGATSPFWSPDGRSLGFASHHGLQRLDFSEGQTATRTLTPFAVYPSGGAWSPHDVILYQPVSSGSGLYRVPANGGVPAPATMLNSARKEIAHRYPQFLPDGRHFIYWVWSAQEDNTGEYVGSLDPQEKVVDGPLVRTWRQARYMDPGYLLYLQGSTLMARRFDPAKLRFTGEPRAFAEHIGTDLNTGRALFSTSATGVLVYQDAVQQEDRIVLRGRNGSTLRTMEAPVNSSYPSLDPLERNVVFSGTNPNGVLEIWRTDLQRGVSSRLTMPQVSNLNPVFSPDGQRIAFRSNRSGTFDLYAKKADGTGEDELLVKSPNPKGRVSWSMDGRFLVYFEADPVSMRDIWVLPLEGDRKPFPFLKTPSDEDEGRLSPVRDGQGYLWMAYSSDETGSPEVYLRPFLPGATAGAAGAKVRVSPSGGSSPIWRKDGRELFYLEQTKLMAVDVKLGRSPEIGVPHRLFDAPQARATGFAVFADGQRFLFFEPAGEPPTFRINVVLNWTAGLR